MGYYRHNLRKLFLTIAAIVVIFEEVRANQLEVAKKYGKRFGNKNRANSTTTDTKEIEKTVTTDPTKTGIKSLDPTESPVFTRQPRLSHSKSVTTTISPTFLPAVTEKSKSKSSNDQEEVDVDLSQLQVSLPNVKFDCGSRSEGYYGDPDYRCEVFHYCTSSGKRDTFLCPSNSKFNQKDMTCDTDAIEELCQSEPAWGQNHLYPTQSASSTSHTSPVDLNKNRERVHIEVTAPKFETKENGFREPVYDLKTRDDSKRIQTNDNNNNYGNQGNTDDNNHPNNQLKDNYNNEENNSEDDNKEIKFNYFGGTFGERQRNNGVLGSSGTVANTGPNDQSIRKNSQINNNNNNLKSHQLNSDFGTVSDANKKGYNKEENGNTNRVTTSPRQSPVVVTLSTTIDSEPSYHSGQQSFSKNSYPFDRLNKPVIQSFDFNSVRSNNKISYESTHSEPFIPSTAADKSYLAPPPVTTETPSSVAPYKTYTNIRQSPIFTIPSMTAARPLNKWSNSKKQNIETYVTERIRPEPLTTPAPNRHYNKHSNDDFVQKPMESPIDLWQQEYDNYETPKYTPVHQKHHQPVSAPAKPPKQIQSENIEIKYQNWSPVGHSGQTYNRENTNSHKKPTKGPAYMPWNTVEVKPQQHRQEIRPNTRPESEQYSQNNEPVYTYPAFHHTIEPSGGADNTLWSSDDRPTQQIESDYKPVKNSHSIFTAQTSPYKPKWAQDMMKEMEELPQIQSMSSLSQQLMPQSSQPQRTHNPRNGQKLKAETQTQNRKPSQIQNYDLFGNQRPMNGMDFADYLDLKTGSQLTPKQNPMNAVYEQFKPYSLAENNPTEYVKKLTENEKQIIKHNINLNGEQHKENVRPVYKTIKNKNTQTIGQNFGMKLTGPSAKPLVMEEIRPEKNHVGGGGGGAGTKSKAGYIPEHLPDMMAEEEFPLTMPETYDIPKSHKTKPKGMSPKHNPNQYRPSKQDFKKQMMSSNIFDELFAAENQWALKHLDTSGLEAAFSHNYPMLPNPLTMQMASHRPKKVPKIPKTFSQSMITHLTEPHRYILGAPLSIPTPPRPHPVAMHQQGFFMPQPMPFAPQLQAQHSMPFPYYMPYMPALQQRIQKPTKSTKHTKQSTKNKNSPKIFKF